MSMEGVVCPLGHCLHSNGSSVALEGGSTAGKPDPSIQLCKQLVQHAIIKLAIELQQMTKHLTGHLASIIGHNTITAGYTTGTLYSCHLPILQIHPENQVECTALYTHVQIF